ncbi:zinc finger MYND domain-containing protein 19-like [Artemia franciscana]|uniref:zinc finger MYND domain-containing protein 19-like n=1 Tax=Artemia franciscana TaxID=6661 RepID=UPI0032DB33EA
MKIVEESKKERNSNSVKLGIVRLGRAAGKVKYALLDESDIQLIEKYAFEARLEIDRNGRGAKVYAVAYDVTRGSRSQGEYLHNLLWEKHYGGIASGFKVIQKNGITVDCRLSNLVLCPDSSGASHSNLKRRLREGYAIQSVYRVESHNDVVANDPLTHQIREKDSETPKETSLYWTAIQQIPPESAEENGDFKSTLHFYTFNGERLQEETDYFRYYECRYPPCSLIEQEPREFSICGRCQEARYCGIECQQHDWPIHKKFCRERRRTMPQIERLPER